MRISDHRYNRDRRRFDITVRLATYNASTATIRAWTRLSPDRIRKLFRSYFPLRATEEPMRRRGKTPRQAEYFLHTAARRFEAATLASFLHGAGLVALESEPQTTFAPTLAQAAAFSQAYEFFVQLCPEARLSIDHADFLLRLLLRRDRIRLTRCGDCARLYIVEAEKSDAPNCGCGEHREGWSRRGRMPRCLIQAHDGWEED